MNPDGYPTIRPDDRVRIQGDTSEYEVVAVSRASHEMYLREPDDQFTAPFWVDVRQVTLAGRAVAQ